MGNRKEVMGFDIASPEQWSAVLAAATLDMITFY